MKTVFKVGMKVYDQMFFPDVDGRIIEIHGKEDKIQLEVKFFSKYRLEPLCMQSSVYYDEKGCLLSFLGHSCKISTLSTSPYKLEMQGFEQKASAPTYEEVIKEARSKGDYYYLPDCLEAPSEELVEATMALLKLLFLRDYYNEGWQPDWKDESYKEIVCFETDFHNKIDFKYRFYASRTEPRILAFKNSEIRKRFVKEQKELLEIAKPLL